MASRDSRRSVSGRILLLAAFIVLAAIAYTAGWHYVAGQIDTRVEAALTSLEERGIEAICTNRAVRGYPFRIGVFCDDIAVANAAEGVAFSAGELRSAGQIYNPLFLVGELDGPASVTLPNGLPQLAFDWENLRASVRLAQPLPERLSVEGRNIKAGPAAQGSASAMLQADSAEAHLRPNGESLDLAARFSGVTIDQTLVQGRTIPPVSGDADISIDDGVALAASGTADLRGRSGTIRKLTVAPGADASVTVAGPVSVDDAGLIDAELTITIRNPRKLSDVLVQAFPEFVDQIRTAFSGFIALGGSGGETPPLPVRIVKGRVSIGFLTVGQIPPL